MSTHPKKGVDEAAAPTQLPLGSWSLDLARRWNSGSYTLFLLHGNIFDIFPVQEGNRIRYVPLKAFLARRLFPERDFFLFYDIGDGLLFGSGEMQKRFFEWLEIYDRVEKTNWVRDGLPRDFARLTPILRRFFLHAASPAGKGGNGITLLIDFAEKIVPATEESGASLEERTALVTLLKWAASPDLRRQDVGIFLVTETAAELHQDLLQNPHAAQVRLDLPDPAERLRYLQSGTLEQLTEVPDWTSISDFTAPDLAARTAGLNLLRVQHLVSEAVRSGGKVTLDHLSRGKKRLIEEYCQGLVKFKDPKPGINLDAVATHDAAKKKLRELAWLIRKGKTDVLERGILLPGRIGVGKSFIVDCFAGECGLPMIEMGDFRSKWVGDTERQQSRILMTIRALGPVIVVVDEADAVFGNRSAEGDSGVSSRVFAAFAAHIGDSTLRGRELWIAMTSRPDLLSIDMKRQGRFGLCIPLFPAQSAGDVMDLFTVIARVRKLELSEAVKAYIGEHLGSLALTGSDVESIVNRARERAVLAERDQDVRVEDMEQAVNSFIDPLDPDLLALQELAAVLACSDRRYLPAAYAAADRAALSAQFQTLRARLRAG